jgi:hypothetical protein
MYAKRPRFYAAEILAMPTREQRRAALAEVPIEWRAWVEDLVRSAFALQKKTHDGGNHRASSSTKFRGFHQ